MGRTMAAVEEGGEERFELEMLVRSQPELTSSGARFISAPCLGSHHDIASHARHTPLSLPWLALCSLCFAGVAG